MDILKALDNKTNYSKTQLQFIVGAWVLAAAVEKRNKISTVDGDVAEEAYDKTSLYSLLYAVYRSLRRCPQRDRRALRFTFNTWGYAWPSDWGPAPTKATDPQRYGKNAYTGLHHFEAAKK